jgi:hypothetical protein
VPGARSVGAATYFTTRSYAGATRMNTHTLSPVRIPERLATDLAAYGNARGLSYSETIRQLLSRGLDAEGAP